MKQDMYTAEAATLNAQEGYKARMAGRREGANPNQRGTVMRDDWLDGWNHAHNSKDTPPLVELTEGQYAALKWLAHRGGSGVVNRQGVLLASGELAGVMRSTWNALRDVEAVQITPKTKTSMSRIALTDIGYSLARDYRGKEASTVEDDE